MEMYKSACRQHTGWHKGDESEKMAQVVWMTHGDKSQGPKEEGRGNSGRKCWESFQDDLVCEYD